MWYQNEATMGEMVGQIIIDVQGAEEGSELIRFIMKSGDEFIQEHIQDCCEHVEVAEIIGNIQDLIGQEIIQAYDSGSEEGCDECYDSFTWTFYTIRTNRTTVVIRWLGQSNGYYSEEVSLRKIPWSQA